MFSPNAWIIIQRVYRAANMGVWALGVAFTLFLLFTFHRCGTLVR